MKGGREEKEKGGRVGWKEKSGEMRERGREQKGTKKIERYKKRGRETRRE